ncbi:hypothetical protein AHiyo8_50320 [Arthrobacter sp. Hiyo8]|nr:hypothetical protein AHiyo8_50320 [Arthrobacter sp. Hiyo8]
MELDAGSAEIVLLAWARHLGFDDEAFSFVSGSPAARTGERLVREDEDAESITFVRLFGRSALVAPAWAVAAAVELSDDQLSEHSALLRISREHGGHGLGTSALLFADDLPSSGRAAKSPSRTATRRRSSWRAGALQTTSMKSISQGWTTISP